MSCASGANDAASQGSDDADDIAGKSEELGAKDKSAAERLARVALRDTKISKKLNSAVRDALAAGIGHDLTVELKVPTSLKGAERLTAIKSAQARLRAAFGKGLEIKQTLQHVPYALVHVKSEEALEQLLASDGVTKVRENTKLVPMAVGVKTPAETATYINQAGAATSLGVPVGSLGSYGVAATRCSNAPTNGGLENDFADWTEGSPGSDGFVVTPLAGEAPAQEGGSYLEVRQGGVVAHQMGVINDSLDLDVSIYLGAPETITSGARLELSGCPAVGACVSLGAAQDVSFTGTEAGGMDWRQVTMSVSSAQLVTAAANGMNLQINVTGFGGAAYVDNLTSCNVDTTPAQTNHIGVAVLDGKMEPSEVDTNCLDFNAGTNCRVIDFVNKSGGADEVSDHAVVTGAVVHAVAPGSNVYSVQVAVAGEASLLAVADGLDWVVSNASANNIKVVSLSYGSLDTFAVGSDECGDVDPGIAGLIAQLRAAGVMVVAPTGNGGITNGVSFPACVTEAVSVTALTSFASAGAELEVVNNVDDDATSCLVPDNRLDLPLCSSNSVKGVTLAAPGLNIDPDGAATGVAAQSGTSVAAAHVAGALAVVNAAFADEPETMERALSRLVASGKKITDGRNSVVVPRLDLGKSLVDCTGAVPSTTSLTFVAGLVGGPAPSAQSVTFETDDACPATASGDSWLTVTPGTNSVSVAATNNSGGADRTGTAKAFGVSIPVSQVGDKTAPSVTSVSITGANGTFSASAGFTAARAVTIALDATDNQASGLPSQSCVMNGDSTEPPTCTGQWSGYNATRAHTLDAGDGLKTIWAFFKDAQNNISAPVSATITLDTTAPTTGTLESFARVAAPTGVDFNISDMADELKLASIRVVHGTTTSPGTRCTSGTNDTVTTSTSVSTWDATLGTVHVDVAADTYKFRICAVDQAGNASIGLTTDVLVSDDLLAPVGATVAPTTLTGVALATSGTLLVNPSAGADFVTGTLSHTALLHATDLKSDLSPGQVTHYCLGTAAPCTNFVAASAAAADYTQSVPVTLAAGTGTKTLYAAFKDAGGNVSDSYPVSVLLDQTAPNSGTLATSLVNGGIALTISNASDAHSGIASLVVARSTSAVPSSCGSAATPVTAGPGNTYTVNDTSLIPGQAYYYRVCTRDLVGNTSTGATSAAVTVKDDAFVPTGTVVIDGADYATAGDVPGYSSSSAADLTITFDEKDATGAAAVPELCLSTGALDTTPNCPATAESGGWITLTSADKATATYPITLAAGDGTRTYNYKFKDNANTPNNVSAVQSASVKVDTKAPNKSSFTATALAGYKANLSWLGITDAIGIDHYTLRYNDDTSVAPAAPADCASGTLLEPSLDTRTYAEQGNDALGAALTVATYRTYLLCAYDKPGAAGDTTHVTTATTSVYLRSEISAPTFSSMSVETQLVDGGKSWTKDLHPDVTITVSDDSYAGGKICINSRDSMSNCVWQDLLGTTGTAQTYTPMNHVGGTGQRKYYAFAKDGLGNTTGKPSPSTVSFYSDRTPPYPGTIRSTATNNSVSLTWTAPKEAGVGLPTSNVFTLFYVEGTSTGNANTVPGCEETYLAGTGVTRQIALGSSPTLAAATHSGAKANTYYRYSLCFVDKLGNMNRVIRTQKTAP